MAITTDLQSPLFYRKLTFDQDKFKNSADEARKRLERLETQQAELGSLQEAEADNGRGTYIWRRCEQLPRNECGRASARNHRVVDKISLAEEREVQVER